MAVDAGAAAKRRARRYNQQSDLDVGPPATTRRPDLAMDLQPTGLHLDWEEAGTVLAALDPWCSPAELQGLLCGAVCADGRGPSDDGWLELIHAHSGEDLAAGTDVTPLLEFRQRVLAGLADDTLAFPLLLPGDDAPLAARLEALGLWCGGFLSGFGLGGGTTDGLDEDAVSALEDMVAIAEVDPESDESEAAEGQFLEVSEYVRMAVLMLLAGVHARAVEALGARDPEAPQH